MNGSATPLAQFLSNSSARFIVPVYQRPYSWTERQCQQLFDDLESILRENRPTHFFGSIVLQGTMRGSYTDYQVIDGQQRLATVLLLFLAIRDCLLNDATASNEDRHLGQAITGRYLLDTFTIHQDESIRLRLCGADAQTWLCLLGLFGTPAEDSALTRNRRFFEERLRHAAYPLARIYAAIQKLVVICITLDKDDDPQLIFESLNATGLALTEGDKVRNYLLMNLSPGDQERLHAKYWRAIERHAQEAVSELIRDFLSVKCQQTPRLDAVYATFKQYAAQCGLCREALLRELGRYAKWFAQLRDCKADGWGLALQALLNRLNRLDVATLRPFALEVLRQHEEGTLSQDDLIAIFATIESYLFRRAICEVPTNALSKIFLTLNADIARLRHGDVRYGDVLAHVLLAKSGSGRFPDDAEFRADLATRQVYKMRSAYAHHLFERLENADSKETKDVCAHLDNGDYSIEHIMPQYLTQAWREALGPNSEEIHATWLHRLANLTLTAYNPNLSDAPFTKKRDAIPGGFSDSGLRLNQAIAKLDRWGEPELKAREEALCAQALRLWPFPKTDFRPPERQWAACTLADTGIPLSNRKPARYAYHSDPIPVKDWSALFTGVLRTLLDAHHEKLHALAHHQNAGGFAWLARDPDGFRMPEKLDEGLFVEKHGSTEQRLRNLRALFAYLGEEPGDLVIYLQNGDAAKRKPNTLSAVCRDYWAFALPTLQEQCPWLKTRTPPLNDHFIIRLPGVRGYEPHYVVTNSAARVALCIWLKTMEENKAAFDRLFAQRQAIEADFGAQLHWVRNDTGRSSWVEYALPNVSVRNHADWPRILDFHKTHGLRLWDAVRHHR